MEIRDEQALRGLYKPPGKLAVGKQMAALDAHCRRFISLSPFLVMGTAGADGRVDTSPKGDAPGFVTVVDDRTLLVPDRMGNNRLDGLRNVLDNPHVGLIFFIPGVNETLRVNGRAAVVDDPGLLAPMAVRGKAPTTALRVDIEEVFLHCAKALVRAQLWHPERQVERAALPSLGRMLADQIGLDPEEADRATETSLRDRLY